MAQIKTFREMKLWGSGAARVDFAVDYNLGFAASADVIFSLAATWPTSGTWGDWIASRGGVWPGGAQVSSKMARKAVQGTAFYTQFSNNPASPDWSLHRVTRNLRETRGASVL